MISAFEEKQPQVGKALFIAWNAEVAGEVFLSGDTSIWFSAVLRGDLASIRIGRGSNIQDGAVLHVDDNTPTTVGSFVTVGHRAILHGCTVGDDCVIGMGAIVLNQAEIPSGCILGAGALVTEGKTFPPGSLIIGSPAKAVRKLAPAELDKIRLNAEHYIEIARSSRPTYRDSRE